MDAPEINEHIQTSMELAAALGFNGTPSFVIGEALVPGFIKTVQFEGYVEGAREAEK
jgi:protein-disulfide isomerase